MNGSGERPAELRMRSQDGSVERTGCRGGIYERSHPDPSCWWVRELEARPFREGWRGVAEGRGEGVGKVEALFSIVHAGPIKEGSPSDFCPGTQRVVPYSA